MSSIIPHVGLYPQSLENPLDKYLNSLNDLKKLDTELVLPGHGRPFTEFKSRIDELIHYHEERNSEILATLKGELKTAYQIAREITWRNGAGWQNMSYYHKRHAILETLAHLEMMTVNGQTGKLSRDSIIYYHQT